MRLAISAALAMVLACDGGRSTTADGAIADRGKSDLSNDLGETGAATLDAGPPQLIISPTKVFLQATATVAASTSPATVVLKNPGESATGPLLMSFTGPDSGAFELHRENCPDVLSPGRTCAIFVGFHAPDVLPEPEAGSEAHATLTVADSEPSGLAGTVDITAVTLVPSEGLAIVGPPDMGSVRLGATGDSLPFVVINTGSSDSGTLRISIFAPQFVKTSDLCSGYSLASAGTCSFALQFTPETLAFQWAILTVQGSAERMVASEIVSGSGIAQ